MLTNIFTPEKFIRASRLSLAMLISVAYITYIGLAEGIAVTMTCAIILYDNPTVGGTIIKSNLRFLGTLLGFVIAMIFIIGFANSMITNLFGIVIGVFIAGYWFIDNKYSYIGIMTCATLPMLLLNNGDIRIAFLRILAISLGVLIAYILTRYFYPDYARNRILITMNNITKELSLLLNKLLEHNSSFNELEQIYLEKESIIIKEFAKFVRWNNESQHETISVYHEITFKIYSNMRHIFHMISVIIFNLDLTELNSDSITNTRIVEILTKLQSVSTSLNINLEKYFIPDEFNDNLRFSALSQDASDVGYDNYDISSAVIISMINTEVDLMIKQLIVIYNVRKEFNYYL